MTTNYFTVSQNVRAGNGRIRRHSAQFFFDDLKPETIRQSFDDALGAFGDVAPKADPQIAVFCRTRLSGPWDDVAVVGVPVRELLPE